MKSNNYIKLFLSFFKIGLFTFGGGLAMIPLIENETVKKHKWVTEDDILTMVTLAESTPGVIAVNSATFIGYKVGGFFGALLATIGVILPSFVIICLVTLVLDQFLEIEAVRWALQGIEVCVAVLIFNAFLKLNKHLKKNILSYLVLVLALAISIFLPSVPTIVVILSSGLIGIVVNIFLHRNDHKQEAVKEENDNV